MQIHTVTSYIFASGVNGGAHHTFTPPPPGQVCSRQTAVIFSLQNMQYIQWHLQANI